jgi:hypothetical protein
MEIGTRGEKIAFYEGSIDEFNRQINESLIALEVLIEDAEALLGRGSADFEAIKGRLIGVCRIKALDILQFIAVTL